MDLHQQFLEWKQERGFYKDSQAFTQLLSEFFAGVGGSSPTESLLGMEAVILVDKRISDLKQELAGQLPTLADLRGELEAKLPAVVEQHIAEALRVSDRQSNYAFKEQLAQLEQRQTELLQEVGTVISGEKSLLSSLTAKVMALQIKLDELSLSVHESSKLPSELSELPSELSELPSELSELPSELSKLPSELSEGELAKRLDVSKATLSRNRAKPGFSEWSQARDPEALPWEYDADLKLYRQKPKSAPIAEEPEESDEEGALVPYDKNNLPEVGDRCHSQMSNKEGEITKTNTRHTYILWDKDKELGLPAVEYSAKDLEVMRIYKGNWKK